MVTFVVMTVDMLTTRCMLILQSCANSPKVVSGLCSEERAASTDDMSEGVITNVEEVTVMDIKVEEIPVVKFEDETAMDIKEEDFPWDVTSPTAEEAEEDQVSYMCVCSLLGTFYKCPIMPTTFCDVQHTLRLFACLATSNCSTVMDGNAYISVGLFETVAGTLCACTSREQ
jgi:hypothetical protein